MARHSRDVSILAGVVYFTQGALGITGISLPLYLRSLKWSVSEIAVVSSIVALPWILKIIYGFLSDVFPLFGYRRKSYLIVCGIISCLGWAAMVVSPENKWFIMASLLIANLGFAATDVITDGLIVEHSRGLASHVYQSIAWGSRSAGAILSGFLGGWLAAHWPAKDVFALAAFLPLFVVINAFRIFEKKIGASPFKTALEPLKRCGKLLTIPNIRWFILLLILMTVSSTYSVPFFFHLKETLGFRETFLGFLLSWGWVGAIIGSVLYGKWLNKISPKVILYSAILLNSLNILSALLIHGETSAFVIVVISGLMSCLTILPIMSVSAILTHHSGVEGSMFAILMSIFNLGQIAFGFIGGQAYNFVGLYPLIVVSAIVGLIGLWVVRKLDFSKPPHEYFQEGSVS